jgi:hypothetical protein
VKRKIATKKRIRFVYIKEVHRNLQEVPAGTKKNIYKIYWPPHLHE